MKIAYCDDEPIQATILEEFIMLWANENQVEYEINVYESAEEMLFEHFDSIPFDFVILDIQMKEMNGIELAKRIRKIDGAVQIAFLSACKEYVFEGYEVQAIRYLLKPLQKEAVFSVLKQVQNAISKEKKYLLVNLEGERRKLEYLDITYIEAIAHYVEIHTRQGIFRTKISIGDIRNECNGSNLILTHRSFIVNLDEVDCVKRTACILADGAEIPISRNQYKEVNEAFINYYRRGI